MLIYFISPTYGWYYQLFCIFRLFFTDIKVLYIRVLICLAIFSIEKKWIKESVLNFVCKIKLNVLTHFKCWLWYLASLLRAKKKKFINGKSYSQKTKMLMKMLWTSQHVNNRWKHWNSEENCYEKSSKQ